jgi:hypothetical protein
MPATTDRGDILHLAGFRRLSPALRDGAPALVAHGEAGAARCGWAPFFRALAERGLAVAWDEADEGSTRFVRREEAGAHPPHPASLGGALASSRRFLRAWRGGAV